MLIEHEIKILAVDVEESKEKLTALGAVFQWTKEFRRYVYDAQPASYERRLRLRTDGTKTQLTFKHIVDETSIDGVQEREVQVDDFDMMNLLLYQLGYVAKAYQENRRHSFLLNDCEVEIDEWPGIPPYIEIEWPSIEKVTETVALIGYADHEKTSDNTTKIYRRYGIDDLESVEVLSFETMS